jgi:glyoxylase-like metal-dependent hydrolase (beta-lactamase superfamily II)
VRTAAGNNSQGEITMFQTTGRNVVLSGTAAAALGLSGPLEFLSSAHAATARETGFVKFNVGDIECTSLYDGIWQKSHDDGFIRNASVDQTKAALEKAGLSADFVPIEFAQTVVKSGGKTILIDAGTGGQLAPTAGKTMAHMAAAGIDANAIDTILISHFHPDHIFGLMAKETNAPIFPSAELVLPEAEYKFWTDPALIDKLPEQRKGLAKRIQATFPNWKNVRQVGNDVEVAPGVRSVSAFGHTPGHTAYHVSSGDAQLMVAGDIANVPALFVANPTWQAVFDSDPEMATQSRVGLFDRVIADKSIIAGYHFGFPNAGTISKDGNGYVFEPAGG